MSKLSTGEVNALFRLLQTARKRGLTATPASDEAYTVPSHSAPGQSYLVQPEALHCTCRARTICTHLAVAYHAHSFPFRRLCIEREVHSLLVARRAGKLKHDECAVAAQVVIERAYGRELVAA